MFRVAGCEFGVSGFKSNWFKVYPKTKIRKHQNFQVQHTKFKLFILTFAPSKMRPVGSGSLTNHSSWLQDWIQVF